MHDADRTRPFIIVKDLPLHEFVLFLPSSGFSTSPEALVPRRSSAAGGATTSMTSLACTLETQRILKCTCKLILRGVAPQVAKSNWLSSTLSVVKIKGFVNDHFIRSGCAGLAGRSCGWLSTHSCTPLRDERTAQIVTTINAVPFNQFS